MAADKGRPRTVYDGIAALAPWTTNDVWVA